MKKSFSIFFVLFLGCSLLFFTQCKQRVKGKFLGTISFTAADLQIVPYHGGDSFSLIDSLGEIIHYTIESPIYIGYNNERNPAHIVDNPEDVSYEDYYSVEQSEIIASGGLIIIYLSFSSPFQTPLLKRITIYPFTIDSHPEINAFDGGYSFDAGKLNLIPNDFDNNSLIYNDSITLINRKFYTVYSMIYNLQSGDTSNTINTLYYSVSQGFVGLKTTKGHIWRLN